MKVIGKDALEGKAIIDSFSAYFIDFDGTFYDVGNKASRENIEAAVRIARKKPLIFVTGRDLDPQIISYIKEINCPYFIALNGAKTYRNPYYNKKDIPAELVFELLRGRSMDEEVSLKIIDFLVKNRYHISVNSGRFIYGKKNWFIKGIVKHFTDREVVGYDQLQPSGPFFKISANTFNPIKRSRLVKFLKQFEVEYCFTFGHKLCEIGARDVSKGEAVERLIDSIGLDKASCVFIGNDINDISAVNKVGCFIAVADSNPKIIEAADIIGPKHTPAGVAKILSGLELTIKNLTYKDDGD